MVIFRFYFLTEILGNDTWKRGYHDVYGGIRYDKYSHFLMRMDRYRISEKMGIWLGTEQSLEPVQAVPYSQFRKILSRKILDPAIADGLEIRPGLEFLGCEDIRARIRGYFYLMENVHFKYQLTKLGKTYVSPILDQCRKGELRFPRDQTGPKGQ